VAGRTRSLNRPTLLGALFDDYEWDEMRARGRLSGKTDYRIRAVLAACQIHVSRIIPLPAGENFGRAIGIIDDDGLNVGHRREQTDTTFIAGKAGTELGGPIAER